MLLDLYLLQTWFAEPASIVYEEDLVSRYGASSVKKAIAKGLLDHRRIPCGKGAYRCVCRLSDKGMAAVRADMAVI